MHESQEPTKKQTVAIELSLLFETGGNWGLIYQYTYICIYMYTWACMHRERYKYICIYIERKIDKGVIFLNFRQGVSPDVRRSGGRAEVGRKGNEEGVPLSASANDKKKIANQTL